MSIRSRLESAWLALTGRLDYDTYADLDRRYRLLIIQHEPPQEEKQLEPKLNHPPPQEIWRN